MSKSQANEPLLDAVIVGAGFSGIAMLHALRELGLHAKVLEAAPDIGGTWYWNAYPGARTDSESWYYCYSFSKALLDKWRWSERYPSQPEMRAYFRFVVEELGLRPYIECDTRVASAQWNEDTNRWRIDTQGGVRHHARYFISAMGFLSKPLFPSIPGLERFKGPSLHTGLWPQEGADLAGKRVGIIGSGSSAVQLLPLAAEHAEHVTLFQRTPNYVFPARNHPLSDSRHDELAAAYDQMWDLARRNAFAMPFEGAPSGRMAADTADEQRRAIYERLWQVGGFRFFFESFDDLMIDEAANESAAAFIRDKIREAVHDPATAEALAPKDYPLFAKRPPSGQGYFEAFNRPNVRLVDGGSEPIRAVEPWGVRTRDAEYPLDILVLATGFVAFTGAFENVPIHGAGGATLVEKWRREGVKTWLGAAVSGFPNFFMIGGPQIPFGNAPTIIEHCVQTVAQCIQSAHRRRASRVMLRADAEQAWAAHVADAMQSTLIRHSDEVGSWFTGANIEGGPTHSLVYVGGANRFFEHCKAAADHDFEAFDFA